VDEGDWRGLNLSFVKGGGPPLQLRVCIEEKKARKEEKSTKERDGKKKGHPWKGTSSQNKIYIGQYDQTYK